VAHLQFDGRDQEHQAVTDSQVGTIRVSPRWVSTMAVIIGRPQVQQLARLLRVHIHKGSRADYATGDPKIPIPHSGVPIAWRFVPSRQRDRRCRTVPGREACEIADLVS